MQTRRIHVADINFGFAENVLLDLFTVRGKLLQRVERLVKASLLLEAQLKEAAVAALAAAVAAGEAAAAAEAANEAASLQRLEDGSAGNSNSPTPPSLRTKAAAAPLAQANAAAAPHSAALMSRSEVALSKQKLKRTWQFIARVQDHLRDVDMRIDEAEEDVGKLTARCAFVTFEEDEVSSNSSG